VRLINSAWSEFDGTALDIAVGPTKAPYIISGDRQITKEYLGNIIKKWNALT